MEHEIAIVVVVGFALMGSVVALILLRGARRSSGCCARCGYDVHGLGSFTCPECGGDLRVHGIDGQGADRRWRAAILGAMGSLWVLVLLLALPLVTAWVFQTEIRTRTFGVISREKELRRTVDLVLVSRRSLLRHSQVTRLICSDENGRSEVQLQGQADDEVSFAEILTTIQRVSPNMSADSARAIAEIMSSLLHEGVSQSVLARESELGLSTSVGSSNSFEHPPREVLLMAMVVVVGAWLFGIYWLWSRTRKRVLVEP